MQVKIGEFTVSMSAAITAAAALIAAVVGSTYALASRAGDANEKALETKLSMVESARDEAVAARERAEQELAAKATSASSASTSPTAIPVGVADASPAAAPIAKKLEDMENERLALVTELQRVSQHAMDPESEISQLIIQLGSHSPAERQQARDGLFLLDNPLSFVPLVNYLRQHREEALSVTPVVYYMELLRIDESAGVQFLVDEMARSDLGAELAYDYLRGNVQNDSTLRSALPVLQSMAIRSTDPLFRTRAKLIVRQYERILKDGRGRPDSRNLFEVLHDIERRLDGIAVETPQCDRRDDTKVDGAPK